LKDWKIDGKILKFTHSLKTKRTLQVTIGNTYSKPREIENGVVQGAVLSMTLFLVAMAAKCRGI
jgi:type II secretory pathway component PulC